MCISTFSEKELRAYFEENLAPRWWEWKPWQRSLETVEGPPIQVGPVSIGSIRSAYRALSLGGRYRYAARKWLSPRNPLLGPEDLLKLRDEVSLDHLPLVAFVSGLWEKCRDILRNHPELRFWIQRRLALLEIQLDPPKELARDQQRSATSLRMSLLATVHLAATNQVEADQSAEAIGSSALHLAAQASGSLLGRSSCPVSANLMIPTAMHKALPSGNELTILNEKKSKNLWREITGDTDKKLMAVMESPGAQHLGFWIPVTRGEEGATIPGAPRAYSEQVGDAVFAADLPPLNGFPKSVERKWHAYMKDDFQDNLFASIPIELPPINPEGREVIGAVLNINARPKEDDWCRAYHQEWLTATERRVAPFAEIALGALALRQAINPAYRELLLTDSPAWNQLLPVLNEGPLETKVVSGTYYKHQEDDADA